MRLIILAFARVTTASWFSEAFKWVTEEIKEQTDRLNEAVTPEESPQVIVNNAVKEVVTEIEKVIIPEKAKEEVKETPKVAVKETAKEAAKETPKEVVKETAKEAAKETPKVVAKETAKEAVKETPKVAAKETEKEAVKEAPKETPKEAAKETPKEAAKETAKEVSKETSKVAAKDTPKEVSKETPKKVEEDRSKNAPKKETAPETAKKEPATKSTGKEKEKTKPIETKKETAKENDPSNRRLEADDTQRNAASSYPQEVLTRPSAEPSLQERLWKTCLDNKGQFAKISYRQSVHTKIVQISHHQPSSSSHPQCYVIDFLPVSHDSAPHHEHPENVGDWSALITKLTAKEHFHANVNMVFKMLHDDVWKTKPEKKNIWEFLRTHWSSYHSKTYSNFDNSYWVDDLLSTIDNEQHTEEFKKYWTQAIDASRQLREEDDIARRLNAQKC